MIYSYGAWWVTQIEFPSVVCIGMDTAVLHTVGSTTGSVVWLTTMWWRV